MRKVEPSPTADDERTETVAGPVDDRKPGSMVPSSGIPRGVSIGRYLVLEQIGRGGMGVVYRAWDPELSRPIALKIVDTPDRARAVVRDRLLREAQALAQLSHPNVVAVHDVGTTDAGVFIAMELVAGETVTDWLRTGPRSTPEILDVFGQAGLGLAAAHAAGLVHRDFKPANVIVGADHRARVLDFGLARPADLSEKSGSHPPTDDVTDESASLSDPGALSQAPTHLETPLTRVGTVLGTPPYMSPEQHAGLPATAASDQFSYCVSLWQALFGQRPFSAKTRLELRGKMEAGALEGPAKARVSAHLEAILRRGLSPKPGDRFPSMAALLDQLRHDPAKRRRTIMLGIGGVAVAMVLGAGWVRGRTAEPPPCAGADSALAGVWNDARRQAIRAAFAATHRAFASDAATGVEHAVDGYVAAWTAMRVEACKATRVRGEQSEHLMDLRMRCLDRRREGLHAQLEVFAAADETIVAKAIQASSTLEVLDGCDDADGLLADIPPPADPTTRAKVDALRRDTARARALREAGKFADRLNLAEPTLAAARTLGYRPAVADAQYLVGLLLLSNGDYAGAERALRDALASAFASRHDAIAADALVVLVGLVGDLRGHYDDGDELARLADAALERVGDPHAMRRGVLLRNEGTIAFRRGNFEAARELHQQALDILERASPDDPGIAGASASLAEDYRAIAQLDRAQAYYERALRIDTRLLGPVHPQVGRMMGNIGNVLADRGLHDQALELYRGSLVIFEKSMSPTHPYIAATLSNQADELRILGRYDEALADQKRAAGLWEASLGKNHRDMGGAHRNLGDIYYAMGRLPEALAEYDRAVEILAAVQTHPAYASTLSARGNVLRDLGRLDEARAEQHRALDIADKALGLTHPDLVEPLLGLARTDLAAGAVTEAGALLERALVIAVANPGDGALLADVRLRSRRRCGAATEIGHVP